MKSSLSLRIFCFCGLAFGVAHALLALVRGEPAGAAIGRGVFVGVFFGGMMAAVLDIMHTMGLKSRGFDPDVVGVGVDVRETIEIPLPPEQALARCRDALERTRVTKVRVDPASATVKGRGRMSWASLGEEVKCRVEPAGGGSRVEIRSRPVLRTTLVDYGKNRQNVERIRAALAQAG